jgi:hypothetical protein
MGGACEGEIVFDMKTHIPIPRAAQPPVLPGSVTGDTQAGQADVQSRRLAAERALDEVLAESFPASDPPSWTLGIVRPGPVNRAAASSAREAIAANADQITSPAGRAVDVSRRSGGERTLIDVLISLAAACGVVLLVPFVILLVGLPVALLVRGFLEAVIWLIASIIP